MPPSIITIETVKALISDVENPVEAGCLSFGIKVG